jgi:hypothetical protein
MRPFVVTTLCVAAVVLVRSAPGAPPQSALRTLATVECASDLGAGVKTKRQFCDVLVSSTPAGSVSMTLPRRTGAATLRFDLHNRFSIPATGGPPVLAYQRHEAVVSVLLPGGTVLGQAAAIREFRTVADLFDQIAGGVLPGGVKAVAPGRPEPARVVVPPGAEAVGIVGTRLVVRTRVGGRETFDSPGRPVAMVSNVRLEYRPAR